MNYYLNLFTVDTWRAFIAHGATVTGFRESKMARASKIQPGDVFVCYLVKVSKWCGALEVLEGPFESTKPIFAAHDPFVVRFRVKPLVVLDPRSALPLADVWNELNRTKNLKQKSVAWTYKAQIVATLSSVDSHDGVVILDRLREREKQKSADDKQPNG